MSDELNKKWSQLPDDEKAELLNWAEYKNNRNRHKRLDVVTFQPHIAGVYQIICGVNGKRYIGQSSCINKRIISHRTSLANGYHPALKLQTEFHKYGPGAFEVEIMKRYLTRKRESNGKRFGSQCIPFLSSTTRNKIMTGQRRPNGKTNNGYRSTNPRYLNSVSLFS
ncbi:GIY-YIG catalytic domain-containing protein [Laceyella sediminis]|uniref:GIY-YIG catalytic domain-containing protein n=1 Tax=Laceyella sediminis TaxID=573074 RepID=A0ABX5ESV7_9BACL|nr:GIY-YIG nuclease family protein [Laceyella sediminis]PRZ15403.1 GIY-YIG catalytic domain-containing protein [Laceyella sediminis]